MTDSTAPSPPPTPPARRRGFRIAALVAGVVIALLLAEVGARLFGPEIAPAREIDFPVRVISEEHRLMGLEPGGTAVYRWAGDPYDTLPPGERIECPLNEHGLRGPVPDPRRPRVLVVGDSFTFGEGVALEDTLVARLETALADVTDPPLACVNAGVPGYGTREQALLLPGWLDEFRPRAVVLVFTPNDPIPFADSMARGSDLMNQGGGGGGVRLLEWFRRARFDAETVDWYRSYYEGSRRGAWEETTARLGTMVAAARSRRVRFGVVAFPLLFELGRNPLAVMPEKLGAACRRLDVPMLDLSPTFAAWDARELWVHPSDHHPNARAHAVAARELAPFVEQLLR